MKALTRMAMFRLFSPHNNNDLCCSKLFDNITFYRSFANDLRCAKRRVYIESPFITTKRTDELIPVLHRLCRNGVQVIINTRCPNEHEGDYEIQAKNGIQAMQQICVTVLYTGRHHRKLAIIDDVLWEGSLNILSQHDSCEVMRRIPSAELSEEMLQFTGAMKYVD